MKHSGIIVSTSLLFSITFYTHTAVDQDFDSKLNSLQQAVATLIEQSDLDPLVAQDLLDKTNELNQYAQANIQQDIQEIRIASAVTSILESADKMLQNANQVDAHNMLSSLKFAARTNVVHKLLIGMYPGQFKDEAYYTNPYLESIGFIINDWAIYALLTGLITAITPTTVGSALQLNSSAPMQKVATRVAAGIAAHFAWLMQKKIGQTQLNNLQQTSNN